MSTIDEKQKDHYNEVEDHYEEHSQHFTYDENCSECFKNVKEFDEN